MPKLTDQTPMIRYDFRISKTWIETIYELPISINTKNGKPKKISHIIHDIIDTMICSGKYARKSNGASVSFPHNVEKDYHSNEKTVLVHFRENPDKIKYLQYFYRTKDGTLGDEAITLPSPSSVIRTCIYDFCQNNLEKVSIKNSDTICPYDGQKNNSLNRWLNYIFKEIANKEYLEAYCEPFMGSANVFLHLDEEFITKITDNVSCKYKNVELKQPNSFFLNDLDTFTYSLIQSIRDNLTNFIVTVAKMPCNETEFNYIVKHLSPASENSNGEFVELTSMQKAVYLFYRQLCKFKNSKDKWNTQDQNLIKKTFEYNDFAFPISASFYNPIVHDENGKISVTYPVEHNLTNYFKLLMRIKKLNALSQKLKLANIYNMDFSKFIKKQLKIPHTLYYIDSPYFYSEDVYSQQTFDHKKLSMLVKQIDDQQNFFVMSNRVTVSSTRKKSGLTNNDAINMCNKYYAGKNYHYELLLFKKKVNPNECQVEILISNFNFNGSTPYDHNITEEEVNNCIIQLKVTPNCFKPKEP